MNHDSQLTADDVEIEGRGAIADGQPYAFSYIPTFFIVFVVRLDFDDNMTSPQICSLHIYSYQNLICMTAV